MVKTKVHKSYGKYIDFLTNDNWDFVSLPMKPEGLGLVRYVINQTNGRQYQTQLVCRPTKLKLSNAPHYQMMILGFRGKRPTKLYENKNYMYFDL
jgi:hypothetical protein